MSEEVRDVKISENGKAFKFRVAGIVVLNDKILVTKMNGNNFYCFPGGHVELLEDTLNAVKRELSEELYFKVDVEKLLYIHENFFNAKNKQYHELCFYYLATPKDKSLSQEDKFFKEMDHGYLINHHYKWLTKDELIKMGVQPKIIVEKFVNNDKNIHLITSDL